MYTSFRQEELNNDYIESLKPAPFHALLGVGISSMCAVLKDLRYKELSSLGGGCPSGRERVMSVPSPSGRGLGRGGNYGIN